MLAKNWAVVSFLGSWKCRTGRAGAAVVVVTGAEVVVWKQKIYKANFSSVFGILKIANLIRGTNSKRYLFFWENDN